MDMEKVNLSDYIALIKVTVRIHSKQIVEIMNSEHMLLNTYGNDDDIFLSEEIACYTDVWNIENDIEAEKLPNGLHHFLIGFYMDSSYDSYHNEYDTNYYGTVLNHTRPTSLNDVRDFMIKFYYNNYQINFNEQCEYGKKIKKLHDSIQRNMKCRGLSLSIFK